MELMNKRTRDSETLGVIGLTTMWFSWVFIFIGIFKDLYCYIWITLFIIGILVSLYAIWTRNK